MRFDVPAERAELVLFAWVAEYQGLLYVEWREDDVAVGESVTRLRPTLKGAEIMVDGGLDPESTSDLAMFIKLVGDVNREEATRRLEAEEAAAERSTRRPN